MNPLTRLYRGSRAFRVLLYVLSVPVTLFFWFLSDNSWQKYTEVGDLGVLALFLLFGVFAWWYDEDRDRRRALKAGGDTGGGQSNGAGASDGAGGSSVAA
jgi:uncharacterized membrane protein YgcG